MNTNEEFDNYYLHQINEEESQINLDEEEDIEISEEKENNIINKEEPKTEKKSRINDSTSKRLRSLPKRYRIYTLDYKKQIIEEVNIIIIIFEF
jgi:hypothetical protein